MDLVLVPGWDLAVVQVTGLMMVLAEGWGLAMDLVTGSAVRFCSEQNAATVRALQAR